VSRFRREWLGGTGQQILTMRAVWPARPVSSDVTYAPSDYASPPGRKSLGPGADALIQSTAAGGATEETSRRAEASWNLPR
jgi:hypothetical protein